MGEVSNPSAELSHPPTPPSLDIYIDLACKNVGYYVKFFSQPSSSRSVDPLDYIVLCSFVPNSTIIIHEDQVVDRIGFEKPTCTIIYDEYVCEYKEEPTVKDDILLSTHHPLFLEIFCDSTISYLSCENPSLDVFSSIIHRTH